jgi:hypothetical protein
MESEASWNRYPAARIHSGTEAERNPFGGRLSVCTYGVVGMGRIGTAAIRWWTSIRCTTR